MFNTDKRIDELNAKWTAAYKKMSNEKESRIESCKEELKRVQELRLSDRGFFDRKLEEKDTRIKELEESIDKLNRVARENFLKEFEDDFQELEILRKEKKNREIIEEFSKLEYNGKPIKVLECGGYNDGYYWDMGAKVEYDGEIYTICDAGSGSGYIPNVSYISKGEVDRLYGEEQQDFSDLDDESIGYFCSCIGDFISQFFDSRATESYQEYEDDSWDRFVCIDEGEPERADDFWERIRTSDETEN